VQYSEGQGKLETRKAPAISKMILTNPPFSSFAKIEYVAQTYSVLAVVL
jgi:hypothetical protein